MQSFFNIACLTIAAAAFTWNTPAKPTSPVVPVTKVSVPATDHIVDANEMIPAVQPAPTPPVPVPTSTEPAASIADVDVPPLPPQAFAAATPLGAFFVRAAKVKTVTVAAADCPGGSCAVGVRSVLRKAAAPVKWARGGGNRERQGVPVIRRLRRR